jgi:hypothetical protein
MKWPFQKKPALPSASPVRERNLRSLKERGFLVAPSLPERGVEDSAILRPIDEIAGRLAALNAVFGYAAAPEEAVPTRALEQHIKAADLTQHMTPSEREIVETPRNQAGQAHGDKVGWRTENAIALAWILGHDCDLSPDGTMLGGNEIEPMVTQWPPIDSAKFAAWKSALRPRPIEEVAAMEELFYCAHNAARSAQVEMMKAQGKPVRFSTVPAGFDPVVGGGVIHERRHALTWAVSPGVAWDDTDLST